MQVHPHYLTQNDSQTNYEGSPEKPRRAKTRVVDKNALDSYMAQNHPTKKDDTYHDCETCFALDTGCNCCLTADKESEINTFGTGITIYFRFVKQLAFYFLAFSLLSIPQLLFSIKANSGVGTLNQGLMTTTIGSLATQGEQCDQLIYDDVVANDLLNISIATNSKTMFACSTGTLSTVVLGYMTTQTNVPCAYQQASSADTSCTNATFLSNLQSICYGQRRCEFLLNSSAFINNSTCSKYFTNDYSAYVQATCENSYIQFGTSQFMYDNVALVCGICDAIIILLTMILIFTLRKQDEETLKNISESEIFISSFSLEFYNLPQSTEAANFYVTLIKQLTDNLNKKYPSLKFHIMDCQFAKDNDYLILSEQKQELSRKRNNLVKKFEILHEIESVTELDLKMNMGAQVLMNGIDDHATIEKGKAIIQIREIQEIEEKISSIETKMGLPKKEIVLKSAWITFETIEQRNLAFFLFQEDNLRDIFSCCADTKLLMVDGQQVKAKAAPHPDDINWQNLNYSTWQLLYRRFISLFLTLALIAVTITAIIFLKYQQVQYQSNFPDINCSLYSNVTEEEAVVDYTKTVGKKGLIQCFCQTDLINKLSYEFKTYNNQKLCQEWLQQEAQVIGWPFLIVLVIIIINGFIQILFTKFSEFEAHKSKSKELTSRLLKVFIVQFINTALVILIINIQFPSELKPSQSVSVLLNGKFDDTTVLWFNQVGTTILLTMLIYILAPVFNILFQLMNRKCKSWADTCCLQEGKFTRKITQEELNEYYIGPQFVIELKYANIMNVICVTYLYGSGLPLLYVSALGFLMLTYVIEKYQLLAICRIPPKTDDSAAELTRHILKVALIWHIIFAIWIYGSPILFPQSSSYQQKDLTNIVNSINSSQNSISDFVSRALKTQTALQGILLLISIALYILWPLVVSPVLRTIFFMCYSEESIFSTIKTNVLSVKQSIYDRKYFSQFFKQFLVFTINEARQISQFFKSDIMREKGNPEYQVLKQERIQRLQSKNTQAINQVTFNGLASYEILMNPKYEQFQQM